VQADRFTLCVQQAPNKDGSHCTEVISYPVLEAGSWKLPDGTLLQVEKLNTSATAGKFVTNQWEHVAFSLPFSDDAQERIRGKCALDLAGYEVQKLTDSSALSRTGPPVACPSLPGARAQCVMLPCD